MKFRWNLLRHALAWIIATLLPTTGLTIAHDGPDPLGHWYLQSEYVEGNLLRARLGPDGELQTPPRFIEDASGESLMFEGRKARCLLAANYKTVEETLPKKAITVSAWVSIDTPRTWGGIIGVIQDNGNAEKGWVLGYDDSKFYFAIATTGKDDGDGLMTYFKSTSHYELGKLYHVVAVFDGNTTELYVNGVKEVSSEEQHGEILYPDTAPYVLGAYLDSNEYYPHHGRIREVRLYGEAATAEWVAQEFSHHEDLAQDVAQPQPEKFEVLVAPYLQFGTQTSMTVMWHTTQEATSAVHFGETEACNKTIEGPASAIHEIRLSDLKPDTQYFYKVESKTDQGDRYESPVATFRTAVREDTPFAFAVISDTQGNPTVSKQIAELAWGQRPNFTLHIGDLVSTGRNHDHWLEHFFPGMRPLINYVPFYPVLGNHEQNARYYYNYVSLPDPEYYYTFEFGNTQFFMLDTNQKVDPDSTQYRWLEEELKRSQSRWKIVCHHHPPFSSDENDYGNLWKTNQGTLGDLRARQLVPLYEEYGVDIVWNGHIHSYERTWPIRSETAVEEGAPFYMITGGGGGGLETAAPTRPYFQNNVRHGHHYVMVHINGGTLELKAFTLDDRLFDYLKLKKP
jgi:predicted phosphodiesterase